MIKKKYMDMYTELVTKKDYTHPSANEMVLRIMRQDKARKQIVVDILLKEVENNNKIDNLELMSRSEHASHHAKDNLKNRTRNNKGQFK